MPEAEFTEEVLAYFGESDRTVNLKVKAATRRRPGADRLLRRAAGRAAGRARPMRSCAGRSSSGLEGLTAEQVAGIIVAYEPVWAIGTGEVCAADEANRVCGVIREHDRRPFGPAGSRGGPHPVRRQREAGQRGGAAPPGTDRRRAGRRRQPQGGRLRRHRQAAPA